MADEPLSIRGIHWRDALPFTNLFRAFRVAIHPSKVLLAMAALLLLYVGGHALDWVWPVQSRAVVDEVGLYEQFTSRSANGRSFGDVRRDRRAALEADYADHLLADRIVPDLATARAAAAGGDHLGDVKRFLLDRRRLSVDLATHVRDLAAPAAGAVDPAARRAVDDAARTAVRAAYDAASDDYRSARRIRNEGLFDTFFEYESNQVTYAVQGVRAWNWFGGAGDHSAADPSFTGANPLGTNPPGVNPLDAEATGGLLLAAAQQASLARADGMALPVVASPGVVPSVVRFFGTGPIWLLTQHPVYFALFGLVFLVVWSVFGGAISRIAAVHVARDEKLSIRSALVFSVGKFLSFLCAPLIPLLVPALRRRGRHGSSPSFVTGNHPRGRPEPRRRADRPRVHRSPCSPALFMALLLLGLVGGFNLMYPTIAVEGSDSFDAISRSFSYVYVRPWRLALLHGWSPWCTGRSCYLFVRLFLATCCWC